MLGFNSLVLFARAPVSEAGGTWDASLPWADQHRLLERPQSGTQHPRVHDNGATQCGPQKTGRLTSGSVRTLPAVSKQHKASVNAPKSIICIHAYVFVYVLM